MNDRDKAHQIDKIIRQSRLFENEIGPGVLQQIRALQEYQMYKARATDYMLILSLFC